MKKILIVLLSFSSCFAYRLQVRNMADDSFQLQVTSTGGAVTAPARAMGNLDYGIDVQVLSGPSNGISGRYVGTGEPNLRVFIQDGLPVITIDATTDNPTQNMTYSDSDKSKAAQIVQQNKAKAQSTPPTIQPAVVVQGGQTQSAQQPQQPATQANPSPNQPATTTTSANQPSNQPSSQQGQASGKEPESKYDDKKDSKKEHPKQSDAQGQQQQNQSQSAPQANSPSSSSGN